MDKKTLPSTYPLLPSLKSMLFFRQEDLLELVSRVEHGERPRGITRAELRGGLAKLREATIAELKLDTDSSAEEKRIWLLEKCIARLSAGNIDTDEDEADVYEVPLSDGLKAFITELKPRGFRQVRQFLDEMPPQAKESLRLDGLIVADWHRRFWTEFPILLVWDEDWNLIGILVVFRDDPHIGTVGVCVAPGYETLGLTDILEWLAATAASRFPALKAGFRASAEAVISAFERASFKKVILEGIQVDGNGGFEDRVVLYLKLRTNEENCGAQ